MALEFGAVHVPARVNGTLTPSPAEEEELYDQILRLQDVVLAGKHASFKLPLSVVELLQKTPIVPDEQASDTAKPLLLNGGIDSPAVTTNQQQLTQPPNYPTFTGLLGLQAPSAPFINGSAHGQNARASSAAGLDPIFLEKSDNLVRAEGQLKRQRLDRELQNQVDSRKHSSREKDVGIDAPSPLDIDAVLLNSLERVKPTSGLELQQKIGSAASSSFDENDYYSSQVQSDWSSESSSHDGSDRAAGAFTADFERLDGAAQASTSSFKEPIHAKAPAASGPSHSHVPDSRVPVYTGDEDDMYEPGDEDDEYTPPDAAAFGGYRGEIERDDDNSDYEPGEIAQDSNIPTPNTYPAVESSSRVPVIRNHLTHIVAPQPNRVSPLATAKGPSIELELVNGRPEIVQKPQPRSYPGPSRVSSASPPTHGINGPGKKRRNKKRKREQEHTGRAKRQRERHNVVERAASPISQDPFIKHEPVSPPHYGSVSDVPIYDPRFAQNRPTEIALVTPRHGQHTQYALEPPRSGLRYEYAQPENAARVASPSAYRPVQRDTQDLRRVASLHYAQRPASPPRYAFSPVAPYRTASMTYGETQPAQPRQPIDQHAVPQFTQQIARDYARSERSRSPPRVQEIRNTYAARAASPAVAPPAQPAVLPSQDFVVDQYGNKYYAAEPAPPATVAPRASVAPVERRPQPEIGYERAPSRASTFYVQPAPQTAHYEPADSRMAPPPAPARRVELQPQYIGANGHSIPEYYSRPPEPARYVEAPTSPIYQQVRGYEQMPPPPAPPTYEPTSPVYAPRSYSVRPEPAPSTHLRQASVAPVQYVRQDAPPPPPMRAMSVMPTPDYGAPTQAMRTYSQAPQQAPQGIRYVDQYGNEVFPREVRQVSVFGNQ